MNVICQWCNLVYRIYRPDRGEAAIIWKVQRNALELLLDFKDDKPRINLNIIRP